jgi:hypothetical protein
VTLRFEVSRRLGSDERNEILLTGVSLAGIFGGVALALWFMPSDVGAEWALGVPSMWMCLGLTWVVATDVFALGVRRILRAENVVMLGIVYFLLLDLVQGLYPVIVSADSVEAAFIAIGLFAGACSLARVIPRLQVPRAVRAWTMVEYSDRGLLGLTLVFFGLGMFRFLWASEFSVEVMLDGLQAARFSAPWSRSELGGWDALTDVLINFGYPLGTFTVMLALRGGRWGDWKVVVGMLLSVIFLLFVAQGGSRRLVGAIVGAGLFTLACGNRRMHLGSVLGVAVMGGALLAVMQVVLEARDEGWAAYVYESPGSATIRVDDNFLRLAQTIEAVPGSHPHTGFQWIWYLVVRPVPRIFWPGKPVNPGFSLPEYLDVEGVSLSTSVIGEWYVALGWPGILLGGLLLGVLARTWSQVLEDAVTVKAVGVYSFGVMILFLGLRSMIELILLCYPLIFWILADRVAGPSAAAGRGQVSITTASHRSKE